MRLQASGHPDSIFPLRVCRNESCEGSRNTIAQRICRSPMKYSAMHTATQRRSSASPVAINESHVPESVAKGLSLSRLTISDSVEQMERNYQSVFTSAIERFKVHGSLNPAETLEHNHRRQHLLQSRITSIREEMHKKTPGISPKMKKILNI